jgi:hypothetical protein
LWTTAHIINVFGGTEIVIIILSKLIIRKLQNANTYMHHLLSPSLLNANIPVASFIYSTGFPMLK